MCTTHHAVPDQETHRRTHHQHHKRTHGTGFVLRLKVKVKHGGQPAEQNKHLVQIADGDVSNVAAQQITFIPSHHGADQGHRHRHPSQAGTDQLHRGALFGGKHAQPIKGGAHEKQHAHPQNSRLAGKKVFEPKHRFGPRQSGAALSLIGPDTQQRKCGHGYHQALQRPPKPTQPDDRRYGSQQDAFFIHVHRIKITRKNEQSPTYNQGSEEPIQGAAPGEIAFIQRNGRCRRIDCCCIHKSCTLNRVLRWRWRARQ